MAFRNSILAGEELVRSGIRSSNYVAGVAGWRVDRNGDAEFNDVAVRGILVAGDPNGAHIQIGDANPLLAPIVRLWPGDPATYQEPGSLSSTGLGPDMILVSPRFFTGDAFAQLVLTGGGPPASPTPSQADLAAQIVRIVGNGSPSVVITLDASATNKLDIVATLARIQGNLNATGQLQRGGRRLAGGCRGGLKTGNTSAAGVVTIAHGLGYTPTFAVLTWQQTGNAAVDAIAVPKIASLDATNINVVVYRTDTSATLNSNPYEILWFAGESW